MGIIGDIVDTGGSMLGFGGGDGGGLFGEMDTVAESIAKAGDDKNDDALLVMSNNNKETSLAQIQSQEMGLTQAAADREMKKAADLELALSTFDTKLQTSKLDYFQSMKTEADRHVEKLASVAADIPSPNE